MKLIFSKTKFPRSLGGNIYEWKAAETKFVTTEEGKYVIEVSAITKNALQNCSKDDDDLRMVLDNYEFGQYEVHDEKISWKGFGTSSSWDGASLKGGTKTMYFFVELNKGDHVIKFYADETPTLKEIKVWQLKKGETFKLKNIKPDTNIYTDKKGIPWLSFVFFGVKPRNFEISAVCKPATKNVTDGDNVKVIINGEILPNEKAPISRKYKNFYFSGDLDNGEKNTLDLSPNKFLEVENTVELWYDQFPKGWISFKLYDDNNDFLEELENFNDQKKIIRNKLNFIAWYLKVFRPELEKARLFLLHSLKKNPADLEIGENDSIVKKVKADIAYNKIKEILRKEIKQGKMEGEVNVEGIIVFEAGDLFASLHGLKTISFVARKTDSEEYEIKMVLFDIYDFEQKSYLDAFTDHGIYELGNLTEELAFTYANNLSDKGEYYGVVTNFNIKITIKDIIK